MPRAPKALSLRRPSVLRLRGGSTARRKIGGEAVRAGHGSEGRKAEGFRRVSYEMEPSGSPSFASRRRATCGHVVGALRVNVSSRQSSPPGEKGVGWDYAFLRHIFHACSSMSDLRRPHEAARPRHRFQERLALPARHRRADGHAGAFAEPRPALLEERRAPPQGLHDVA
jgi:hypothetical protein